MSPEGAFLLGFFIGVLVSAVVGFYVIKNNKKKFLDILEMDPEEKAGELIKRIKSKF